MNPIRRAKTVFDIEMDALRRTRARLDDHFVIGVNLIAECLNRKGKVIVTGIGKSGNIGQKIAATLTSTGTTSVVLNALDALHGDIGIINDGDVVLALSYTGESEELLRLLPAIKRFDVKIIAMTGHPKSRLARHSDVVLNLSIRGEACPFNLAPTASTAAMLVLGDALAMCVLEARGFKKRDASKPFSVIAPTQTWIYRNCFVASHALSTPSLLPGPYTLVFDIKRKKSVAPQTIAGLASIGIRIPKHWISRVVRKASVPLVTTSVNESGEKPASTLAEIKKVVANAAARGVKVDLIVFEGALPGKPSRVIDFTKPDWKITRD